ncbi:unnamed protein product, partial [Brassica rapa]
LKSVQYVLRATVESILKTTLPHAMESITGKALKDSIKIVRSFPDMDKAYSQLKTLRKSHLLYHKTVLVGDLAIIDISANEDGSMGQAMPDAESKVLELVICQQSHTFYSIEITFPVLKIHAECMVNCTGFHFDTKEGNILLPRFLDSILGIRAGKGIKVILACVS